MGMVLKNMTIGFGEGGASSSYVTLEDEDKEESQKEEFKNQHHQSQS
jgi:hypothetical protein